MKRGKQSDVELKVNEITEAPNRTEGTIEDIGLIEIRHQVQIKIGRIRTTKIISDTKAIKETFNETFNPKEMKGVFKIISGEMVDAKVNATTTNNKIISIAIIKVNFNNDKIWRVMTTSSIKMRTSYT